MRHAITNWRSRIIALPLCWALLVPGAFADLLVFDATSEADFNAALWAIPNQFTQSDWPNGQQSQPVVRQGPSPVDIFSMSITSSTSIDNLADALGTGRQSTLEIALPKGDPAAFSANVFGIDASGQAATGEIQITAETNLGASATATRDLNSRFVGFIANGTNEVITRVTIVGNTTGIASRNAVDDIRVGRLRPFTPSVSATGGSGSCTGVTYGQVSICTLTPEPDHQLVGVSGCGGGPSSNPYATGPITGNCTISAYFVNPNAPHIIPSLSEWALGLLACAAALLGAFRLRRT